MRKIALTQSESTAVMTSGFVKIKQSFGGSLLVSQNKTISIMHRDERDGH